MINKSVVFYLFKNLFEKQFGEIIDDALEANESDAVEVSTANQLFDLFLQLCNYTTEVTEEEILDYEDDCESEISNVNSSSDNDVHSSPPKKPRPDPKIRYDFHLEYEDRTVLQDAPSLKTMETIVRLKDDKNLKFKTIQKLYPWLQHSKYINRYRDYVNQRGKFYQKVEEIEEFVAEKFKEARSQFLPVNNRDLRNWSLEKARELGLNLFKASLSFLRNLKIELRISSRRITSVVTKRHVENEEEKKKAKDKHLSDSNNVLKNYSLDHVLNSDQSSLITQLTHIQSNPPFLLLENFCLLCWSACKKQQEINLDQEWLLH